MKTNYILALLLLSFYVGTSQNGNIRGVITDPNGFNVPGANVLIENLGTGNISDENGEFLILNVPEGEHNLTVKYLGYENIISTVSITANQTTTSNFVLTENVEELEGVVITGYQGGQARALNSQKNKTNITNIVSTDQIGKFPDANVGDALKRIPGITMQVDQGEARNIIVRGLAPQLNSVTLNGSRIPSAESDNRNVQMDLIPSDMIQTIEVNKAVTPDMDADALGGSVNLITRSSPQNFRLSATAGSGVNFITDKRILTGSFLVGDRTENKKFGWMVSASVNDNDFGSDNVEAEWKDSFEYNTGVQDENGDDIMQEVDVNPYASEVQIRKYLVQRIRRSVSLNFDYEIDVNNTLYFKSMYNWRDDRENRFANGTEILDGEDISFGDFEVENGNLVRFPVEGFRQLKGGISGKRNQNTRLEDQRMQNYSLSGDHLFGNLKVDWMGSYAKAMEEKLNERYIGFESEYMVLNEVMNTRTPLHLPVSSPALSDFEFDEITQENSLTEEIDKNIFINFELPADFFGNGNGFIKFGARGRFKNKTGQSDYTEYEPLSGIETLDDVAIQSFLGNDFLAGNQYIPGSFPSAGFLGGLDLDNTNLFEAESPLEEFLGSQFEVKENVYAGYLMANQKLSDKLSVLAGIRLENTVIESTGNELIFDEDGDFFGSNVVNDKSSYSNILPGVHFKYDLSDLTVLRFAWTNTLSRPNYEDLVPFREVNNEDREIVQGNPDLNPTTSMAFDFMAERYFRNVGILSGGVFYKNLKNFIYTFVTEDQATGYDVFQPLNGDNAQIFGAEVSLQRQLDFLPGFAKNFGIYLNYTYLNATADGITNEDGDTRGDLDLPGAAPHMFNGSFFYDDKKFSARLSANFSDAYLDELGGNSFEDRYYDNQFFLDFNVTYAINKNLRVYADVNNITNQPLRFYQGVKNRTMQMEYYSTRLTFGVKYDLF